MAPEPDRLNGWKDIAAHVGKSVRQTQRWERELELPVKRLSNEVVFAWRSELDAWMVKRSAEIGAAATARPAVPPAPTGTPATAGIPPSPDGGAARPRSRPATILAIAAIPLLVAIVAALVARAPFARPAPSPASTRVDGHVLDVLDAAGDRLWTHSFSFDLNEATPSVYPGDQPILLEDLDGDGAREVLVSMRTDRAQPDKALYVFNPDGSLRFRYQPATSTVSFGADTYAAPWLNYKLFVVRDAARQASIFTVFIHGTDFPARVAQLAPDGRVLGEYWSNGYVELVAMATWQGRPSIILGGTNNETKGASLAVFDAGRFGGSTPAATAKYRCASCPAGGPRELLIFPRRCLSEVVGGQATIHDVWRDELDRLQVLVAETPTAWAWARAWYAVSGAPRIDTASYATGYVEQHRVLTQRGTIGHRYEGVDEAALLPVRRWHDGGFVTVPSYAAPATGPVTRQTPPVDDSRGASRSGVE